MRFEIYDYDSFRVAVEELCKFLSSCELPQERVFDSRLVAHELLANVLEHSGGKARLIAEVTEGYIHLTVRAERAYRPPTESVCPDAEAERGRGLFLVDSVSAERVYTNEGEILVRIQIK